MQPKLINPYPFVGTKHKEALDFIIANLPADPTFDQRPAMLRYEDIVAEASGYFLVPKGRVPAGWRMIGPPESQKVYGRGYATVVGDSHDEPGCPYGSGPVI